MEIKNYRNTPPCSILEKRPKWANREYREAYLEASVEQGVAWQIRINRSRRGMTQKQLADALGTRQSAVSRIEDPTHGAHNLDTLVSVAKVFDCALSVRLISYSQLAYESEKLGEADLFASPYDSEMKDLHEHKETPTRKPTGASGAKHLR